MLVLMIWVSESITCEEEEKEGHGRKGGGGESWRETLVLSKVGTSSLAHASVSVGLFITLLSEPCSLGIARSKDRNRGALDEQEKDLQNKTEEKSKK